MAVDLSEAVKKSGNGGNPLSQKSESLTRDAIRRLLKNRAAVIGGIIIILLYLMMIFADKIAPYDYATQVLSEQNAVPPWLTKVFPVMESYAKPPVDNPNKYILGADYVGRDLLSRIIYGSRVSLIIAIIGPLISLIIGVLYGCIAVSLAQVDNFMIGLSNSLGVPGSAFYHFVKTFFRTALSKPIFGHSVKRYLFWTIARVEAQFIIDRHRIDGMETNGAITRGQVLSLKEKNLLRQLDPSEVRSENYV